MTQQVHWICPAVTPLFSSGEPDFESAGRLYDHLAEAGLDGVLVGGSIGEFFAFSAAQRLEMARFAVRHINHRLRVIVGTAHMNPEEAVRLSRAVLDEGADAVILVPPFYFPFQDEEVFRYFSRMAKDIAGPLYLYNFPDRTGYGISPDVVRRLADTFDNIIGIKDTIVGMDHTRAVIEAVHALRPEFEVYSGFDENFAHNVLSGGSGCIGGISNVVPAVCAAWVQAVRKEDWALSASCQRQINRLMAIYGFGSPFVPYVKEACRQAGHIACAQPSFPMPTLGPANQQRIHAFLKREGVL